jgi:D-3-phosphoglycerate dehydrogenase
MQFRPAADKKNGMASTKVRGSMTSPHVLVADWLMSDFDREAAALRQAGLTYSLPDWRPPPPSPEQQKSQLLARMAEAPRIDAVLFQLAPLDSTVIAALPEGCKLLQRMGTGLDTVDLDCAAQRGIAVRNTPFYCIEEVALHAMAMLLSLHRQLDATQQVLLSGRWVSNTPQPIERLSTLTLGIVGLGRIGRRLAEIMHPLVGRVAYHDPDTVHAPPWADALDLEDLLRQSDLISLHCPLRPETRHLIDERTLAWVKPTTILVNVARGALVEPNALAGALDGGRLAGAGLDVYEPEVLPGDSPLRRCRNAILTSHTAWCSRQAVLDARTAAIQYIIEALVPSR